ncbi:hypothetical protein Tco_0874372, partial [Tanacetum coccineum]
AKDAAYHKEKMILCKQEEAAFQLNAEQAGWRDNTDNESDDQELEAHYMYMAQVQEVSLDASDNSGPIFDTSRSKKDMSTNGETVDQDDDDLGREHDLLASLINKLKCEIDDRKNHNKFLESSNKTLVDKVKGEIEDFKTKNKSLESSNNHFKEANNELSKTNQLMFKDLKTFQDELEKRNDANYMLKVELECAIAKAKLIFVKPEFLKKSQRANPRLYDIGCYNDNLDLMLAPESDETIRLAQESRSKLSDLIRPFDYNNLNNLYDLFISQREKSPEQRYFSESVETIFDGVERCKQTIAKRTYFGHIDPFIQNTIEGSFCPQIQKINVDLKKFHLCLKEKMVADLRYFNSLENEVDSFKSQLETRKTQFLNEIDRLSKEYYYVGHMNAILGVYTTLDEFTDLQCDYVDQVVKCERLEKELSKSNTTSKSFEALQQHAINLELALQ